MVKSTVYSGRPGVSLPRIPFRILRLSHLGIQECFSAFPSNLAGKFPVTVACLHMEKCAYATQINRIFLLGSSKDDWELRRTISVSFQCSTIAQ